LVFEVRFYDSAQINEMVARVHDFVANNDEIMKIFVDFGSSPLYRWAARLSESWGARLPPWDADVARQQVRNPILAWPFLTDLHITGHGAGERGGPTRRQAPGRVTAAGKVGDGTDADRPSRLRCCLCSRTSNAVVSFVTFITFLFYLLSDDPLRYPIMTVSTTDP
jgi:hypothetical protein